MVIGNLLVLVARTVNAVDDGFATDAWQRHDFDFVESRDAVALGPECDAAWLG
jgi:hypothetical protein